MKQRWKRALPALVLIALVLLYAVWTGGGATGTSAPQSTGSASYHNGSLSAPPDDSPVGAASASSFGSASGSDSFAVSDSFAGAASDSTSDSASASGLDENGSYTTRDDVALYVFTYGHLPSNFITKKQAEALGWKGGSLEPYAPGKSIGGSHFGNYEGTLPEREGRRYTECDIDTQGANKRGAKRIVFSNDGLIYYTGDHYKTFTLLYGEE